MWHFGKAQVSLDCLDAGRFERVIEMYFLAGHRFRFDDSGCLPLADQIDNDPAGFSAIVGPMHMAAAIADAFFEFREMLVEVSQRGILDASRPLADQVRV